MVYTGTPCDIEVQRIGKMITANATILFTNVYNKPAILDTTSTVNITGVALLA